MNRTLKWILYVALGLVALVVVAGVITAVFGGFRYGGAYMMRPGIGFDNHMQFGYDPIRILFGGILCLGVILLVILGIVALVLAIVRGNRPAQIAQPAPTAPPSEIATPEKPCPNCGRMTQEDWKTCPYCGTPLA